MVLHRPGQANAASLGAAERAGPVRRAPELSFGTPSSQSIGISDYDEYYSFDGSLEHYDWKYVGKKELYVP